MAAAIVVAAGLVEGYGPTGLGMAIGLAAAVATGRLAPHGAARRRARVWSVACAIVVLRVGVATVAERTDARIWRARAIEGERVPIEATVALGSVRPSGEGAWSVRGSATTCRPRCDGVTLRWRWVTPRRPALGSRVRVRGALRPEPARGGAGARFPPLGLVPGGRRGVVLEPVIEPLRGPAVPLLTSVERHLRERIGARFGAAAPLVVALVLGDRGEVDAAIVDAFATTGTLHLLAVSGLHVGFLAWALVFGLRIAGAGPAARAACAVAVLVGYAGIVGGRPSVVRATIMIGLLMIAGVDGRRVDPWQVWGAAATAILTVRPLDLFGLGFALSFSAVAGLLALAGPLERLLERPGPGRPPGIGVLSAGLVATTAASAGTLIVQAATFGWLAPIGFAVNPVVVPVVAVALPLTWGALAFDAIGLRWVAGPVADAVGTALLGVETIVVESAARVGPWAPGPGGWLVAAGVAAGAALVVARRRPGAGLLVATVAVALVIAVRPPRRPAWEITWLDVGQGDAIAIRFPGGTTWLVDAGPADPHGDAGIRTVLPWLRRHGIGSVERLVTTHPDLDHVGGAASVIRGVEVETWSSGGVVAPGRGHLALLAARGRSGPPRAELVRAGMRWRREGVTIDALHPSPAWVATDPYAARVSANEGSIVLLMRSGPCGALLTGDLGRPGERALVGALGDSLRAELLHVGHHGSRHSSTSAFLARVRPREAVASVGRSNRHGHPHPDALERLAKVGARVWRTDRAGSITARCGPSGWRISSASP